MPLVTHGYLQQPYLQTPYLASTAEQSYGSQVNQVIAATKTTHMQTTQDIVGFKNATHSQVKAQIVNFPASTHSQVNRTIAATSSFHMQVSEDVVAAAVVHSQVNAAISAVSAYHSQVNRMVASIKAIHSQANLAIVGLASTHSQVRRVIAAMLRQVGMQVQPGTFLHEICGEYLIKPYLATPYLANDICAQGRFQVNRITTHLTPIHMQVTDDIVAFPGSYHLQVQRTINAIKPINSQVARTINFKTPTHTQVQRVINATKGAHSQVRRTILFNSPTHMQISRVFAQSLHLQVTLALYNTINLRVLDKFPSRGTTGLNWVASSTAAGDYGVNNVNNDIVEFAWRSNTGDVASITLSCDTQIPQGVFLDTLAILGHNLTTSAVVTLQGTNDGTYSSIGFEQILETTSTNMYYIAPMLPLAGYRYWRFLIDDPTNTVGFLQIGTIVFGAAIIFVGEDMVDQIKFSKKHFKDLIPTEGFTNVSNDRAIRKTLGMVFRDIDFAKSNYMSLSALFDFARTSLKCLWIPTPQYPTRFAVFGKLTQLPEETHNDKGKDINYIDLNLEVDESL